MPKRKRGQASTQRAPSADTKRPGAWRLFSIGHSNHSVEELLGLLRRYGIETVVDVRSAPGSRYVPHFDAGPLRAALAATGLVLGHIRASGAMQTEAHLGHAADSGAPEDACEQYIQLRLL